MFLQKVRKIYFIMFVRVSLSLALSLSPPNQNFHVLFICPKVDAGSEVVPSSSAPELCFHLLP